MRAKTNRQQLAMNLPFFKEAPKYVPTENDFGPPPASLDTGNHFVS